MDHPIGRCVRPRRVAFTGGGETFMRVSPRRPVITRRPTLALLVATLAALTLALPAAARTAAGSNDGAIAFADPAGDAGGAPDIRAVEISSTRAGVATFRVDVPVVATDRTSLIGVAVDADDDTGTGDPAWGGADYKLESYQDDHSYAVERWDASTAAWVDDVAASTVDVSWDSTGIDFSINRRELGNAGTVDVFAFSYASFAAPQDAYGDIAPDTGADTFDLSPLELSAALFRTTPARAGSLFGLVLVSRRSDTGDYVGADSGATVSCAATGAGRRLGTLYSRFLTAKQVPSGACAWKLDRRLKSKVLTATIRVMLDGRSLVRTVRLEVR